MIQTVILDSGLNMRAADGGRLILRDESCVGLTLQQTNSRWGTGFVTRRSGIGADEPEAG